MTAEGQRELCKKLLDRLREGDIENKDRLWRWIDKSFKVGSSEFNGRDIRNLISSALAIARAGNQKLTPDHLDIVKDAKMVSQKTFTEARTRAKMDRGSDN